MFATYNATNPGKNTLNIRATPGGAVIDTMADGQTAPVEVIERGWCKLDNGYADARFLTITAEPPAGFIPDDADDNSATVETGVPRIPKQGVPMVMARTAAAPSPKTVTTARPPSRPLAMATMPPSCAR